MVTASRRPSSAEGRFSVTSSQGGSGGISGGVDEFGGLEGGEELGEGGLEESAKSRFWGWKLHDVQIDGRADGRLGIRRHIFVCEKVNESKKSLGVIRASGCMASLLRLLKCGRRCRVIQGL